MPKKRTVHRKNTVFVVVVVVVVVFTSKATCLLQ